MFAKSKIDIVERAAQSLIFAALIYKKMAGYYSNVHNKAARGLS